MTPEQTERLIVALESLVKIVQRLYPEPGETQDAEMYVAGETRPEPQSREEYDAFPSDGKGRFERIIEAAQNP